MAMTTHWVCDTEKFWGTVRQLTECAKCGGRFQGGMHAPRRIADMFKPSVHFLCDDCYDTLPD